MEEKVILKSRLLENTCRFSSTKCIARIVAVLGPSASPSKQTNKARRYVGNVTLDRPAGAAKEPFLSRAQKSRKNVSICPPLPSASSQIRLTAAGQDLRVRVRLTNPQSARNHRHHPPLLFFSFRPTQNCSYLFARSLLRGHKNMSLPQSCAMSAQANAVPLSGEKKSLHLPFFPPSFFRK